MSVTSVMGKVVNTISKMEGSAGKVTLSPKQVELMAGQNGKAVSKLMSDLGASHVDVAYKAKSNYAIAGLKLRNGENVVGSGAISIQNPGTQNTVIKYRSSVGENGKVLTSNGFVDAGVPADSRDIAFSMSRKGDNIAADVAIGKTAASHVQANEVGLRELASDLPEGEKVISKMDKGHWTLQQKMDEGLQMVRRALQGKGEKVAQDSNANKIAKFVDKSEFAKASNDVDLSKFKEFKKF